MVRVGLSAARPRLLLGCLGGCAYVQNRPGCRSALPSGNQGGHATTCFSPCSKQVVKPCVKGRLSRSAPDLRAASVYRCMHHFELKGQSWVGVTSAIKVRGPDPTFMTRLLGPRVEACMLDIHPGRWLEPGT